MTNKYQMYISIKSYVAILLLLFSCNNEVREFKNPSFSISTKKELINTKGNTIKTRFNPPNLFTRINVKENSFEYYLQNFPLKPYNSKVHLFNGELKYNQNLHSAVLDLDVGKRDLQQCADAIMRLRAEFLYNRKRYEKIHFNFTNGFNAEYSKWRKAYRIKVNRNKVSWVKTTDTINSYASFRKYLTMVFSYAGTLSLEKELQTVAIKDIQIGDVFIQGGSPGHAIIVVDMAINSKGDKMFLLAQSYMPAQEIHVLKNLNNKRINPWYSAANLQSLITPEWTFTKDDLRRFE